MSATQPQGKAPYQKPQMEIITLSQSEEFFSTSGAGSCEGTSESPKFFNGDDMPAMAVSRESRGWERW